VPILKLILSALMLACSVGPTSESAISGELNPYPGSASARSFGANLFLVADRDRFLADWNTPGDPARVETASTVKVGGSVEAVIAFWGCAPDTKGECHLYFRISVYGEDGSPISSGSPMPVWSGKPPPPAGRLALGETAATLTAGGKPAHLRVEAVVTDRVAGESVVLGLPLRAE
jgi:hypothetical protein